MCDAQLSASVVSAILPGRQIFRSSQPFKSTRIPAVQRASGQMRGTRWGRLRRHKRQKRDIKKFKRIYPHLQTEVQNMKQVTKKTNTKGIVL